MIMLANPVVRVEDYINLVRSIARGYADPHEDIDDSEVFGDGMFGLAKAVEKFSCNLGAFSTYASLKIRCAIIDGLRRRKREGWQNAESLDEEVEVEVEPEDTELACGIDRVFHLLDGIRASHVPLVDGVDIFIYYHTVCPSWRKVGEKFGIPKSTAQFKARAAEQKIRLVFRVDTVDGDVRDGTIVKRAACGCTS